MYKINNFINRNKFISFYFPKHFRADKNHFATMDRHESIAAAVEDIKTGKLSVRKASEKYNISKTTIWQRTRNDNKSKRQAHEKQMSLKLYQEELIVNWIWMEDSVGRAPT